ncbi:hypothetical protein HK104_007558 [Borealophlyctis nickersoniae]|nr:hypothetical protein HK104_007558 [Borealophlyctis nickersoniae]
MSRLLTRLGHTVTTACDGSEALDTLLCPDTVFDLVFLDNQMPVMSGIECVRRVREMDMSVLVCGVTGNAMKEDQEEFYDAGVDRVLTKPVRESDILAVIDTVLTYQDPNPNPKPVVTNGSPCPAGPASVNSPGSVDSAESQRSEGPWRKKRALQMIAAKKSSVSEETWNGAGEG